jgi:signal transduction histidine kinase
MVRLWVHDSGSGLPASESQRIFERFVKGSDQTGGSGLGLSIVAAIAEAHGGYARLRSSDGKGARFEIVIPGDSVERGESKASTSLPTS